MWEYCVATESRLGRFLQAMAAGKSWSQLTKVETLTEAMLGKPSHRDLSTKAMETKQLTPFCQELLVTHAARIGAPLVD